ncbi:unnamed protein product [marine sediment metagenome]|uniref:Uncharacterized protein n=1 Tax=marine sediment metagenome TaxID=412755 RepID=X0TEW5_9ZZZZ
MFRAICDWIRDEAVALPIGPPWVMDANMFPGFLPQKMSTGALTPHRCLVVLQNTPAVVWGHQPDMEDKPIQLWNRSKGYWEAEQDAQDLFDMIHGFCGANMQIGAGTQYLAMTIEAMGSPAPIENPGPRGFVFSTNYMFRVEEAWC